MRCIFVCVKKEKYISGTGGNNGFRCSRNDNGGAKIMMYYRKENISCIWSYTKVDVKNM